MAGQNISVYRGNEPFVFISYSHRDTDIVLQILSKLQEKGFRIWFDAGIEVGTEWPARIGVHIKRCAAAIFFITKEYVKSHNCKREVVESIGYGVETVNVFLEEDVVIPDDIELDQREENTILAWQDSDPDHIVERICKIEALSDCTDGSFDYADTTQDLTIKPKFLKYLMRFGIVPSLVPILAAEYFRIFRGDWGPLYWILAIPGYPLLGAGIFYYTDRFLRRTKKGYTLTKSIMAALIIMTIAIALITGILFMIKLAV
ncbi:MAG: TIR domain-containing protein [Clostridia bacterium]|nr:TIR domain-containing protein [Clostridia bacterium]